MTDRSSDQAFRLEHDSMGEVSVPADALWGAQTQRARENFRLSALTLPPAFIRALALIKWAAAGANGRLGLLSAEVAQAIQSAALAVADGRHDAQFPLDVFQTGSGTSSNMNVNEVIAHLAGTALGRSIHANDHVNLCQSSNDVIPTAIHVSASLALEERLLPALIHLSGVVRRKSEECADIVTTGRTHLMDAMPITLGQELGGWAAQVEAGIESLHAVRPRMAALALGGTAVGTGINAHPSFAGLAITLLSEQTGYAFAPSGNYFAALSSQDAAVELSGVLKTIAVAFIKIANDLRWMNSGPLAGLGEIALRALQPGSSIMPGKVNPVIPEAVAMLGAQVIGNDATITLGGQSGNFQLNTMLPVIAYNLLQSIELLANGARALADSAVADFVVDREKIAHAVERNPILVTALNPLIGYERAAEIAKRAYAEGRAIVDVAAEMTGMARNELQSILDAHALTQGGLRSGTKGSG